MTDETSVALFFVYRPEREHGSWRLGELARQRYPHRYREIEVRPLPADSSRVLVSNAADGELPESVAELLAERSGGNPFFLEEAFRDLVERGVLERRNGGWELAVSEDELSIPAVVQGTLQARLDRLDRPTRDVLSIAAVIGRTFGLPLLERLVDRDQLMQALTDLQRLDLIVEKRRRPNPEYRFRHGLVQEVAYASLVDTQRRKLHKRVGEALEEIYKESPEEAYGLLARHFEEADEPEKAVDYLLKAGDAARAVYADKEALEHYRRARGPSWRASATSAARATRSSRWRSPTTSPSTSRAPRRCTTRRSRAGSARTRAYRPPRGSRPRPTARASWPPATSTRPRPATSRSCSSAGSSWSTRS